ncbi:MAG: OmpH family outer membrane protein [Bacteroidota bacterium]
MGIAALLINEHFAKPEQAFINNQQVFQGFEGRKELHEKLEAVITSHQLVLDSLYALAKQTPSTELIEIINQKSEQFRNQELALSERYTQQAWIQINDYLNEFGKSNNYQMIFGANGEGNLMYANQAHNATQSVIEFMNKKYNGEID